MASPDNKPAARHPMQPDPAATPLATRQLPYSTGVWDRDEIDAVVRVLEGPRESLMIGANVAEFEEKVAALFGHDWKPDDLVIWNNYRTLHSAAGHKTRYVRTMNRTTLTGEIDGRRAA